MKRLICVTAALLMTTPALSAELICVLNTKQGEAIYTFERVSGELFAETSFEMNRKITARRPGSRPPWKRVEVPSGVGFVQVRDPRYMIVMGNEDANYNLRGTVLRKNAYLFKGKTIIGRGGCGFEVSQYEDGI